ncbi:MAG TPA: ferric reductase-like transmembrane domain-containing protein, partial [Acidimicrobiia bacterium]|nr:ferric reductase-like transmembrane domain-containing protein [Acidimicrobiia bacterium]
MSGLVVASSSTIWYLSRATGVVTLVLLTLSVLLGIVTSYRWSSPEWPRFVIEFVHRNVSLLVVAFLALHVTTVVADAYAPIGWKDAVVPFASPYRPFWLGLGAVGCDLVIALVVTSLLRHRLGFRTWRVVHWLAYVCWPVAVLHGLGTGTDTKVGVVLVITALCVVAVLAAALLRLVTALADRPAARTVGLAAWGLAPVALAIWMASGPLASGWARRAGTPASVIAKSQASQNAASAPPSTGSATSPAPSTAPSSAGANGGLPAAGFDATVNGSSRESGVDAQGLVTVSLVGSLDGGPAGNVDVELHGEPLSGGGVQLERGTVTLTGSSPGDSYSGNVIGLRGNEIIADVANARGVRLRVVVDVTQLDVGSGELGARVSASPESAADRGERS